MCMCAWDTNIKSVFHRKSGWKQNKSTFKAENGKAKPMLLGQNDDPFVNI